MKLWDHHLGNLLSLHGKYSASAIFFGKVCSARAAEGPQASGASDLDALET